MNAIDDSEDQPDVDDGSVLPGAVPTDDRPLRVGERVRSTIVTPVFPSDPKLGDVGRVMQASSASYLVRWDAGGESWAMRSNLEPLRSGQPIGPGARTSGPPPRSRRGNRAVGRFAPLLFLLLVARGLLPELGHVARHPTPLSVALIVVGLALIVALVVRARRRAAASSAALDPKTTGTTDDT
jgi:hypothetical protein